MMRIRSSRSTSNMWCWLIFFSGICIINASPTDRIARSIKTRIVGGKIINIEDAPYQVSVHNLDNGNLCGGSIISAEYILTAGHCVEKLSQRYLVRSGSNSLDEGGETHDVIEVIRHEKFLETEMGVPHYDVTVMRVDPPFELDGKTEKIIELFEKDERVNDKQAGFVSGWGLTEEDEVSEQLKGLSVKFIPNAVCNENYKSVGGLVEHEICATHSKGDSDFCNGDSGGPLVVDGRLAGLVSWSGPGCAIPGLPGVYTEVAGYRDWIDEQIKA